MKVSEAFPSKYVAAHDLGNQDQTVTIAAVVIEEVGAGDHKPILYFHGQQKGLVLNRVNANTIETGYGDEMDNWIGLPITLFATETEFGGKRVPCIRVRPIPRTGVQLPPQPPITMQQPQTTQQQQQPHGIEVQQPGPNMHPPGQGGW